ncbi:hypothetical protein GCM10010123_26850 [Pilimelia anulata]|uniref:Type VII secretion system protein EccE domain-containing protein n=1 Tax=Pilimelia anulata TaxID=53371 RepID=A0A8J3FBA2_9ACTN|nr:type VII secretion protein EccE [Pilimelia anulata]GGJ95636.1 hypothetical protein GCM10010123_26850 [Pilimelia anulata]
MSTPTAVRPAPGRRRGIRVGQVVAAQAAVVLPIALAPYGIGAIGAGTAAAAVVIGLAWLRLRHRWLYEWLAVWAEYAGRRRTVPPGPDVPLALAAPGSRVLPAELDGETAAVLADGYGLTAVLAVGDPGRVLGATALRLPAPAELAALGGPDGPALRGQVVLGCVPAAGGGPGAAAYRELTGGRLPAAARALVALRAPAGGWSDGELRRALSSAVRKLRRRHPELAARPLGPEALRQALAELAGHDPHRPGREGWRELRLGGLVQAGYRLRVPADPALAARLLDRLPALPAAAVTVAVSDGAHLAVRLAAADRTGLAAAGRALAALATAHRTYAVRRDGRQRAALAATLPLGGARLPGAAPAPAALAPAVPAAGLLLGADRAGAPVPVRLFRPEPTRLLLVGGVGAARLLALRALAVGARVVVRTTRAAAWAPLAGAAGSAAVTVALPGAPLPALPPDPLHPLLTVIDAGPAAHDLPADAAWHAQAIVRDEVAAVDSATLALADLVVLQPLPPAAAALVGGVLGLGTAADWLTRIRPDMVGAVSRRTLRWAALVPTPAERRLLD